MAEEQTEKSLPIIKSIEEKEDFTSVLFHPLVFICSLLAWANSETCSVDQAFGTNGAVCKFLKITHTLTEEKSRAGGLQKQNNYFPVLAALISRMSLVCQPLHIRGNHTTLLADYACPGIEVA